MSPLVLAAENLELRAASLSPRWLKIYHYERRSLGGFRSAINSEQFFFAKNGRSDPEAELRAAITAFANATAVVGTQRQPAACVFPARKTVLEELTGLKFPEPDCSDLRAWIQNIDADQVHLVYAGAYPANPASVLGHTFLRLANSTREKTGREGTDLLSYDVGFQAQTDMRDSRVLYMLKGLSGGYFGSYEIEKHYIKVGLYNNSEARDLWDVGLNFSRREVDLLVKHIWELTFNARLNYYFLDENCSFRLLTLLQAVRPNQEVSSLFPLIVLPSETVRRVMDAGWTESAPAFRVSIKRRMNLKLALLDRHLLAEFEDAKRSAASVNRIQDATVLDALMDYWLFENYRVHTELKTEDREKMEAVFTRAADLKESSRYNLSNEDIRKEAKLVPPFLGHGASWVDVHAGASAGGESQDHVSHAEGRAYGGAGFRLGAHPLWSPDKSYSDVAAIEYLGADIEARSQHDTRWSLLLLKARSLEEMFTPEGHFSWTAEVQASSHCLLCQTQSAALLVSGGMGVSTKGDHHTFYGLAHLQTAAWQDPGLKGLIAPGLIAGARFLPHERLSLVLEGSTHWWRTTATLAAEIRVTLSLDKNEVLYISHAQERRNPRSATGENEIGLALGLVRFF